MMRRHPQLLVVVAGTGTEIGKTWLSCRLIEFWRSRGLRVAARKPAQSYDPSVPALTDSQLLAGASGEEPSAVSPYARTYATPFAPPMAAEALGEEEFAIADLARELNWTSSADVGIVELAGGLGSPQAADGDGVDLVAAVKPDLVVVVAGAGLGTLSHLRLARRALPGRRMIAFLNRFDPSDDVHTANLRWLTEREGLETVVDPSHLAALCLAGSAFRLRDAGGRAESNLSSRAR